MYGNEAVNSNTLAVFEISHQYCQPCTNLKSICQPCHKWDTVSDCKSFYNTGHDVTSTASAQRSGMGYRRNFLRHKQDLGLSSLVPDPCVLLHAEVGPYLRCALPIYMQIMWLEGSKYWDVYIQENHKITVLSTVTDYTGPHHGMELYHLLPCSNSYM